MSPFVIAGSASNDVRQIQRALNLAGRSTLPRLNEDGVMGPKTNARVVEFQRTNGLKPDGIVGPKTRQALKLPPAPGSSAPPGLSPPPVPGAPPLPSRPPTPGGASTNAGTIVTDVVNATRKAFSSWKPAATFRAIRIVSVSATGAPGCLTGPSFSALILTQIGALQNADRAVTLAAAEGIGRKFAAWQNGVTVPGLPWYPAFAAFPAPIAPPVPNVPTPLMALPSAGLTGIINAAPLQQAMAQAAGASLAGRSSAIFAEIAAQVAPFFQAAIASTIVTGVLGTGPVPTFAPPLVPLGPVMNGTVIESPGHLS